MNTHKDLLKRRCRFGNCLLRQDDRRVEKKIKFSNEFNNLFGIDVTSEDSEIYPELLCNRHCCLLRRAKSSFQQNGTYETCQDVHQFQPHSDQCSVCAGGDSSQVRAHAGPGRGHKKNTVLVIFSLPV